jgi:GTP-binding protein
MLETWAEMPDYFTTSAESDLGRDEVLNLIETINEQFIRE